MQQLWVQTSAVVLTHETLHPNFTSWRGGGEFCSFLGEKSFKWPTIALLLLWIHAWMNCGTSAWLLQLCTKHTRVASETKGISPEDKQHAGSRWQNTVHLTVINKATAVTHAHESQQEMKQRRMKTQSSETHRSTWDGRSYLLERKVSRKAF